MRISIQVLLVGVVLNAPGIFAQSSSLSPQPTVITAEQAADLSKFDTQLILLPAAKVVHADSAQVFMFGEAKGRQAHVLVPSPAIDAAHVGDVVEVTGRVRRFSASEFEHEYSWFKKADYSDVHQGDWVIVATSVRTQEGSQLVPGNTISNVPPDAAKTTKMPTSKR